MTDYHKFVHALEAYLRVCKDAKDDKEKLKMLNEEFISSIKDLKCNDFYWCPLKLFTELCNKEFSSKSVLIANIMAEDLRFCNKTYVITYAYCF